MANIEQLRQRLLAGMVIPAHPLALRPDRTFDEVSQRRLSSYYLACGAGGLAVGVHTTQFAIHDLHVGLLRPVLEIAAEVARDGQTDPPLLIAGLCGDTRQAIVEAGIAKSLGYDAGLMSLAAFKQASEEEMLAHCEQVSQVIPLFGFYLQPAVGGRVLSYRFWRTFCELENVVAIKVAPFNRYQTLDVVRALFDSGRSQQIALYTGNDDSILFDLCSEYVLGDEAEHQAIRFQGGLLGHWACWTRSAVELHRRCQLALSERSSGNASEWRTLMMLAHQVTDMNAAIFDAANQFRGCIAGIQEVLYRQGLIESNCCLDERETLSPGQAEEIARVRKQYPHLLDDEFIHAWLT